MTDTNPISAAEVTKGGFLLALAGKKTRTIGQTNAKAGDVVMLRHGSDTSLAVPVVVDAVFDAKPFKDLTEAEITEAGFTSREALLDRLATTEVSKLTGSHSAEDFATARFNINHSRSYGQYTFHIASPAEIKAAGLDGKEIAAKVAASVAYIRTEDASRTNAKLDRDGSIERAESQFGPKPVGKERLNAAVDAGVKSLDVSAGRAM